MVRFLWRLLKARRELERHVETWGAEASLPAQQDRWPVEGEKTHTN
jgi:hypothetical protein